MPRKRRTPHPWPFALAVSAGLFLPWVAFTIATSSISPPLLPALHAQGASCPTFASTVARIGAETRDVVVAKGRAYLALDRHIRVVALDAAGSEPVPPPVTLESIAEVMLPSPITELAVDEARDLLVAATEAGAVHVYRLGAASPELLIAATISDEPPHIALSEGRIFAGTKRRFDRRLLVLEIVGGAGVGPWRLIPVGQLDQAPQGPFFANDGVLYARHSLPATRERAIVAIDVSNPAAPVIAGGMVFDDRLNDMAFTEGHAIVATSSSGPVVLDLEDPLQPRQIGRLASPRVGLNHLTVAGSVVFGSGFGNLHIVDVSEPTSPKSLAVWDMGFETKGLAMDGDRPVLAAHGSLRVLSAAEPAALMALGRHQFFARGNNIEGPGLVHIDGRLYAGSVANAIHVFDLADPSRPREESAVYVGGGNLALAPGRPGRLWATEGFFIHPGRLMAIDLAAPEGPRLAGVAGLRGAPGPPAVLGDTVFVNDLFSDIPTADPSDVMSLTAFDGSDPSAIEVLARIEPPGDIIALHGSVGYRGLGEALRPVDLADPAAPVFADPVPLPVSIRRALVVGDRLYLAGYDGLAVLDIAAPMTPRVETVLPFAGEALAQDGGCLYLTYVEDFGTRSAIVHVFDIGGRGDPLHVSDFVIDGADPYLGIQGLAVADGWLYAVAPELFVVALGRAIPTATDVPGPPVLPTPSPYPTASASPTHSNLPTATGTPTLRPTAASSPTADVTVTAPSPDTGRWRIVLPVGWR